MDKLKGSMESLNSLQLTEEMAGLDAQSKALLRSREVLAVILQEVVTEYKGYSKKEVMEFIEPDSIVVTKEVSPGRTNSQIRGDNGEFFHLNEKATYFDSAFRAKNPLLSSDDFLVSLHIDMEPQKTYRPGYPIEKRGIYYLARRLSAQLSLITENTDYKSLEKCYSIWICRDDIPREAQYSISVYEMTNTRNTSSYIVKKESYDLLTLVVIKLGNEVYNGKEDEEGYGLLRFLNAIMYPHTSDFMDKISENIDFSDNEEFWKEAKRMTGLGQSVYDDGVKTGREEGREEGIKALVLDNLEDGASREQILRKLQKRFQLTEEASVQYFEKFSVENE